MSERLTNEIITRLKSEHEELHQLTAGELTFVVVPPSRAAWQRFSERVTDDAKRLHALEQLARDCVVFPSAEAFDNVLQKKPATAAALFPKLSELAGAVEEVEAKKL